MPNLHPGKRMSCNLLKVPVALLPASLLCQAPTGSPCALAAQTRRLLHTRSGRWHTRGRPEEGIPLQVLPESLYLGKEPAAQPARQVTFSPHSFFLLIMGSCIRDRIINTGLLNFSVRNFTGNYCSSLPSSPQKVYAKFSPNNSFHN